MQEKIVIKILRNDRQQLKSKFSLFSFHSNCFQHHFQLNSIHLNTTDFSSNHFGVKITFDYIRYHPISTLVTPISVRETKCNQCNFNPETISRKIKEYWDGLSWIQLKTALKIDEKCCCYKWVGRHSQSRCSKTRRNWQNSRLLNLLPIPIYSLQSILYAIVFIYRTDSRITWSLFAE